jgi:hypothetical protein
MKKETLEEVAEKETEVQGWGKFHHCSEHYSIKKAFINGAKWQAERMYSEEEVHNILDSNDSQDWSSENNLDYWEWFEQFKKK